MFDSGSFKNNKFVFKDTGSGEIKTFIQDDEFYSFIYHSADIINIDCILDILKDIADKDLRDEVNYEFKNIFTNNLETIKGKKLYNFVEKNYKLLDKYNFQTCLYRLSKKYIVRFYNKNKDVLDEESLLGVLRYLDNKKKKIEVLNNNPNFSDEAKIKILRSFSAKDVFKMYKNNEFEAQKLLSMKYMLNISNGLNSKSQIKFVGDNLPNLTSQELSKVQEDCMSEKDFKTLLKKYDKNLNSEQLTYKILCEKHNKRQKLFKKNINRLDDGHKQLFTEIFKSADIKNLSNKIMSNFNITTLINPNTIKLISEKGINVFGEDTVYDIFKYLAYEGEVPSFDKALDNVEIFTKFKDLDNQKDVNEILNIKYCLEDFNSHYGLIEECMKEDLTKEEESMLLSASSNHEILIENKEDLKNYPAKRTEYIKDQKEKDAESALMYLLTGYDKTEYNNKLNYYFNDDQLSVSLDDLSESLQSKILLIKSATTITDLIMRITPKNKEKVFSTFLRDLEQEFSPQGSIVAKLRNSFTGFENEIKNFYGKELKESLAEVNLPEPQKQKGVDVINLQGEQFKLLVHGLNAYGSGSAKYENREIGATYVCTSLISNNHLERAEASIYYGFKNISDNSLILEGSEDICSDGEENSLKVEAYRSVRFLKTDKMIAESAEKENYNEIVLNRKGASPDYIVAFGEISPRDIMESKRLNIPIVKINEKIYEEQIIKKEEEKTKNLLEEKTAKKNKHKISEVGHEMKSFVFDLLDKADENCTALQQKAIMEEVAKAHKLSVEEGITLGGK